MKRESGVIPELYPQLYAFKKNFLNRTPLSVYTGWEGNQKEGEPEYLPKIADLYFAFGDNSKSELQFIVIHFHY